MQQGRGQRGPRWSVAAPWLSAQQGPCQPAPLPSLLGPRTAWQCLQGCSPVHGTAGDRGYGNWHKAVLSRRKGLSAARGVPCTSCAGLVVNRSTPNCDHSSLRLHHGTQCVHLGWAMGLYLLPLPHTPPLPYPAACALRVTGDSLVQCPRPRNRNTYATSRADGPKPHAHAAH